MILCLILLVLLARETNMQRVLVATSCSASDNQVRKWRVEKGNVIATTGQLFHYVASQLQVDEHNLQINWMNPKIGKYEEIKCANGTIDLNFQSGNIKCNSFSNLPLPYRANNSTRTFAYRK